MNNLNACSSHSYLKNNILHQFKNYKNHFENSNFWGMWPLGQGGHVIYSFINMLFISMGIFMKSWPFNTGDCLMEVTHQQVLNIFFWLIIYIWFFCYQIQAFVKLYRRDFIIENWTNLVYVYTMETILPVPLWGKKLEAWIILSVYLN
jgi:hypothetical protein